MGFVYANSQDYDVIATVDDDNIPLDGWGEMFEGFDPSAQRAPPNAPSSPTSSPSRPGFVNTRQLSANSSTHSPSRNTTTSGIAGFRYNT